MGTRLAAYALVLPLLGGCGKAPAPAPKVAVGKAEVFHVDPSTAGTVAGKITYTGAKPKREIVPMDADAGCLAVHAGKPVSDDAIMTGKDGALANAFVYIQSGLEGKHFEPVTEPVLLDQKGCLFAPRIVGVRVGQPLSVSNSDPLAHNIHPMPQNNREWNEQQSPQTPAVQHRFARAEIMIPVKCNVHAWMRAYLGVVDHPYYAVTGADGSFQWSNVPPGEYTVAVWHEKFGAKAAQVKVESSGHATANFTYE
jgi:hypothetical protein